MSMMMATGSLKSVDLIHKGGAINEHYGLEILQTKVSKFLEIFD